MGTANDPTPPDAPLINTFCARSIFPLRKPCRASTAAWGMAAACSNVKLGGFNANALAFSRTHTYSAKPPQPQWDMSPNTSSPTWNCFTFSPIASIRPAMSQPRIFILVGLSNPTMKRFTNGFPIRISQSQELTDTAWTFTRTSLFLGVGFTTCLSSK